MEKKARYYSVLYDSSQSHFWTEIKANSLQGAKRAASKEWDGYGVGTYIKLVECTSEEEAERLNDMPYYRKLIISGKSRWEKIS